jgi:hypothetical protein
MRDLASAVSHSRLDPETKAVLERLAWSSSAWDSGLIRDLAGPVFMKQIVWSGKTLSRKYGPREIYLFDSYVRPVAEGSLPLVCVVMDQQGDVVAWQVVAIFSVGFMSATLDDEDVLTITTIANFFTGKGIYRYAIGDNSITELEDGNFIQFENEEDERAGTRRELLPADPALEDAVERIRSRRESL